MKDYRAIQADSARRERRALLAENVSFDKFRNNAKQYPPGSVHYWAIDCVYGPVGSADKQENRNAA